MLRSRFPTIPLVSLIVLLAAAPAVAQGDQNCLACHGDKGMFAGIEGLENPERLFVDESVYRDSIHGRAGVDCSMCHQDLLDYVQGVHKRDLRPVRCDACHKQEGEHFRGSLHGYALEHGNARAPTCSSCHGSHDIPPLEDSKDSPVSKVNLPNTCAKCHGGKQLLTDKFVKLPESFKDYTESVHGQGVEHGVAAAASCDDCHEVHDLRSAADPASRIHPKNQSATCGKCHPDIRREYDKSIHGRAVQAGVYDSPTCTDCHGEHMILSPSDEHAKTHSSRLAKETCGKCHDDPVIIAKYSLERGVVGSYTDSYHGWATARLDERAATCISCHTAHSVQPRRAPESTVNPNNVVATCQQCHPKASERFARSYNHETASIEANPLNKAIKYIYLVLIVAVIGGMVLHNLVIMNFFMMKRREEEKAEKWVLRFDRVQIVQHLLLTVSFTALVITGFALRYPNAWWVLWLHDLGMTEAVRQDIHRAMAVLLVITALSHMWYIFFTGRGKKEWRSILPRPSDAKEMVDNLKYHSFKSEKPPRFGRYDYSQKMEYWALVWGTILMIFTGLVLWFPEQAVKIFPTGVVAASQTVHYYEAWLATLAIIVWHFFFVIFHPEEYPMSWTWLTGRMSAKFAKKHHTRWYEEEMSGEVNGAED